MAGRQQELTISTHTAHELAVEIFRRLVMPVLIVLGVFTTGVIGYWIIGYGHWSLFDCIYMTSITMTTVGYGEVMPDLGTAGRAFSVALMWGGFGVTVYATSVVTGFIVEEHLGEYFQHRRRRKMINKLDNHYILCGIGRTGIHVLNELHETGRSAVCIDNLPENAAMLSEQYPDVPIIVGDATDESVLREAGIERAFGLIACLPDDGANMILTVNARYLKNGIKIATRCVDYALISRFKRAGADYVISPNFIGGMRMVSEIVRPHTVGFLDKMLRNKDAIRVEEVIIGSGSELDGKTLAQSNIHERTQLNVIAFSPDGSDSYVYNPNGEVLLKPGAIAVVIGNPEQVKKLKKMASADGVGS